MGSGAASAPPARECARPSGNRPSKYVIIFTNMSTKPAARHDRPDAVEIGGGDVAAVACLQADVDAVLVARSLRAAEDPYRGHEPLLEPALDLGPRRLVPGHLLQAGLAEVLVAFLFLEDDAVGLG